MSQDTQPWEQGEQGRPKEGRELESVGGDPGHHVEGVARCSLQFHSDSTGAGALDVRGRWRAVCGHPAQHSVTRLRVSPQALSLESSPVPALQADSSF